MEAKGIGRFCPEEAGSLLGSEMRPEGKELTRDISDGWGKALKWCRGRTWDPMENL